MISSANVFILAESTLAFVVGRLEPLPIILRLRAKVATGQRTVSIVLVVILWGLIFILILPLEYRPCDNTFNPKVL